MSLTADQRAAQNRENAKKSTGPRTEEGKAKSRFNALKHGLRADAASLPGEDPTIAAARAQAWNDHYDPQSPAAQTLINQCVQLSLSCDRVNRYHDAEVTDQILNVYAAADDEDENEPYHAESLRTAAAAALIIEDAPTARLYLRYHAQAHNGFLRALRLLFQTLTRDRLEAAATAAVPAPAAPPAETPIEAEAAPRQTPNEAGRAAKPTPVGVPAAPMYTDEFSFVPIFATKGPPALVTS